MTYRILFFISSSSHAYILQLLHRPLNSVLNMFNVITAIVNEMVLGQVVTFPQIDCIIAETSEKNVKCWESAIHCESDGD